MPIVYDFGSTRALAPTGFRPPSRYTMQEPRHVPGDWWTEFYYRRNANLVPDRYRYAQSSYQRGERDTFPNPLTGQSTVEDMRLITPEGQGTSVNPWDAWRERAEGAYEGYESARDSAVEWLDREAVSPAQEWWEREVRRGRGDRFEAPDRTAAEQAEVDRIMSTRVGGLTVDEREAIMNATITPERDTRNPADWFTPSPGVTPVDAPGGVSQQFNMIPESDTPFDVETYNKEMEKWLRNGGLEEGGFRVPGGSRVDNLGNPIPGEWIGVNNDWMDGFRAYRTDPETGILTRYEPIYRVGQEATFFDNRWTRTQKQDFRQKMLLINEWAEANLGGKLYSGTHGTYDEWSKGDTAAMRYLMGWANENGATVQDALNTLFAQAADWMKKTSEEEGTGSSSGSGRSLPELERLTVRTVTLSDLDAARSSLAQVMSARLGRQPTSAEVSRFLGVLNSAERRNPTTTTTNYTYSDDGTRQEQTVTREGRGVDSFGMAAARLPQRELRNVTSANAIDALWNLARGG